MGWLSNVESVFTGSGQRAGANAATSSLQQSESQALSYLNPYNQAGQSALSPLTALLTGNQYDPTTGQFTPISTADRTNLFYQNPGYQFSLQQGLKAVQSSAAAQGNLLSGGAQKEIAQYTSGLASQNYNDYISQLFSLASTGSNAAQGQANVVSNIANPLAESLYSSDTAGQVGGGSLLSLLTSAAGTLTGSGNGFNLNLPSIGSNNTSTPTTPYSPTQVTGSGAPSLDTSGINSLATGF